VTHSLGAICSATACTCAIGALAVTETVVDPLRTRIDETVASPDGAVAPMASLPSPEIGVTVSPSVTNSARAAAKVAGMAPVV
jgi:predicted ATPase with chaperone activity